MHSAFTPTYAFGILLAVTGAQSGAEMRMRLADDGFSPADCELWAQLFDTFDGGRHTAATVALLRERREDYEDAAFRTFEHEL